MGFLLFLSKNSIARSRFSLQKNLIPISAFLQVQPVFSASLLFLILLCKMHLCSKGVPAGKSEAEFSSFQTAVFPPQTDFVSPAPVRPCIEPCFQVSGNAGSKNSASSFVFKSSSPIPAQSRNFRQSEKSPSLLRTLKRRMQTEQIVIGTVL